MRALTALSRWLLCAALVLSGPALPAVGAMPAMPAADGAAAAVVAVDDVPPCHAAESATPAAERGTPPCCEKGHCHCVGLTVTGLPSPAVVAIARGHGDVPPVARTASLAALPRENPQRPPIG